VWLLQKCLRPDQTATRRDRPHNCRIARGFCKRYKQFVATGDPLLMNISNLRKKRKKENIYILILRRLTPSVHLLANSKGNHVTGKKPLAAV
jgi:hypothetical protein